CTNERLSDAKVAYPGGDHFHDVCEHPERRGGPPQTKLHPLTHHLAADPDSPGRHFRPTDGAGASEKRMAVRAFRPVSGHPRVATAAAVVAPQSQDRAFSRRLSTAA